MEAKIIEVTKMSDISTIKNACFTQLKNIKGINSKLNQNKINYNKV
jgi:hypothetical protein